MSVSIDIFPASASLDMYGEPDSSSAYSLSGHVSISVKSPYAIFERRRPTARLLLQSILLTFEGQSEIITPQTGYSAVRLCSITREIAPCDPVELTNEGHEDSSEPCVWNIIFSLPIPGWLPATSKYSIEDVGVRYSLFAEAKVIDSQGSFWSFTSLCMPFLPKSRTIKAQKMITLTRTMSPAEGSPESSIVTYLVNSLAPAENPVQRTQIPPEVLSKIQVLASVPDYVDVEGDYFPLVIRMRTKGMDASDCRRIRLSSIAVNIVQSEKSRCRPTSEYLTKYPVPPASEQPPNMPLRDAHPISSIYDIGLYVFGASESSTSRSFSLLPSGEQELYSLGEDNHPFAADNDPGVSPTWYTLETKIPFVHCATNDKTNEWAGLPILRPTATSPLLSIRHEALIELTCIYNVPDSDEEATERLRFSVPIRFAALAPAHIHQCYVPPPPHPLAGFEPTDAPILPALVPYAQNLPPYSQLFDRNGDRKIDYSVPLPRYTPQSSSSSIHEVDIEQKDTDESVPLLFESLAS